MNNPSFDRDEDRVYAFVDQKNGVTDNKSYVESLQRPRSNTYVVMPDGTVQFLR
jgi:hypothetical protein